MSNQRNKNLADYELTGAGGNKNKQQSALSDDYVSRLMAAAQGLGGAATARANGPLPGSDVNLSNYANGGAPALGGYTYNAARPSFNYNAARPEYSFNQAAPEDFSYREAPEYASAYNDQINSLVDSILNRQAFSYDHTQDPLYKQYAETYGRNGRQAMNDTYAQMAARTGGLASSYAGTAAQGAYNKYMQALNDKIPELYQIAYQMYNNEGQNMRNNLAMIQGLENTDYNRYMDTLGQYNTDRNFAYGQHADRMAQWNADRNFAYNQYADALGQYNTDRNFAYNQYADALAQYNADRNFDYKTWADAQKALQDEAAYQAAIAEANSKADKNGGKEGKEDAEKEEAGKDAGTTQKSASATDGYPYDRINNRYKYEVDAATGAIKGDPQLGSVSVNRTPATSSGMSFTWNGRTFASKEALQAAIARTPLTDMEAELLNQQLAVYGITLK